MAKKQSNSSPSVMLRMLASSPFRNTSLAQTSKAMEERMHKGISFCSVFRVTAIGANSAVQPTIISVLKMLLPTTLPIAISALPFKCGRYADRQFRGRRSESDDCQSDNDVGYTETVGLRTQLRPSVRWHLIE